MLQVLALFIFFIEALLNRRRIAVGFGKAVVVEVVRVYSIEDRKL